MPFRLIIILSLLLFSLNSLSQNSLVYGFIMDSASKKPISGASIKLKANSKTNFLHERSTISDSAGVFHLNNLIPGKYSLVASNVGYTSTLISIEFGDTIQNIGIVYLQASYNLLNSVVVYAQKHLYNLQADKITFSVNNDSTLQNKMAYDAVLKMPFVSTDFSGTLQYKSGKKYIVLVNGYRYGLISKDPSNILKSIPSAFIKSIELQTVPENKYANLGYEAVINIITIEGYLKGYLGSLASIVDTRGQTSDNIFYMTQKTKFGFQGFSRYESNRNMTISNGEVNELKNGTILSSQTYTNKERMRTSIAIADLSLQYNHSEDSRLSLYLSIGSIGYRNNTEDAATYPSNSRLPDLLFTGSITNKDLHKEIGFDFVSENKIAKSQWNIRSKYSHDNIDEPGINHYDYANGVQKLMVVNNSWRNLEYVGEANFTKRFNKGFLLEESIRPIIRRYIGFWRANPALNIDTFRNLTASNSDHSQYIFQSSNSLRKEWKNSILQVAFLFEGVRYENKNLNDTLGKKFVNFLPKIVYKFPIRKNLFLEFKYERTVTRPNYFNLGNYYSVGNSQNITAGNTSLNQQVSNEFSISTDGALFKNRIFYYLTASHAISNSMIAPIVTLDSTSRTLVTQYKEAGKYQNYVLSIGLYTTLLKNRLTININNAIGNYLYDNKLNSVTSESLFNSLNVSVIYQSTKTVSYNFMCYANSASPTFQGKETTTQDYQFSISKTFLQNKILVKIYISDPFLVKRKFVKNIMLSELAYNNITYKQARLIGLSISYRFGKLNATNKSKRLTTNDLLEKK